MTLHHFLQLRFLTGLGAVLSAAALHADSPVSPPTPAALLSYADIADLTDSTPLVIRAQPRTIIQIEPERARGLRPGWGRFYVEARTEGVIAGTVPLGEQLRYLVDLPLDAKGKPTPFKKKSVVLFARPVSDRPGEVQLVRPDAQILWDPVFDMRLRGIIREFFAPDAPHRVTGVREAIHVGGDLVGSGETQLFLSTANGEPAAITVSRQPGAPPRWSVSFSEVVAGDVVPPPRDTLAWYRLACFLPAQLQTGANISSTPADRAAAVRDYRFVIEQLGPCARSRK